MCPQPEQQLGERLIFCFPLLGARGARHGASSTFEKGRVGDGFFAYQVVFERPYSDTKNEMPRSEVHTMESAVQSKPMQG